MAETFQPPPTNTLLSVLDWFSRPGHAVRNVFRGNLGGAGRQALDVVGEAADAAVPFVDLYTPRAKPEDYITGSQMLGYEGGGAVGGALDAAVDLVTNPLSALSFNKGQGVQVLGKTVAGAGKTLDPLTLAGKGLRAVEKKLPTELRQKVQRAELGVRQALGWEDLTPEQWDELDRARALGNDVSRAGGYEVERIFQGVNPLEDEAIATVFHNVRKREGKWAPLDQTNMAPPQWPGEARDTLASQKAWLKARLDTLLTQDERFRAGVDRTRAEKAIEELVDWNHRQWTEAQTLHGATNPSVEGGRIDYLMRTYKRETPDDLAWDGHAGGTPSPLKRRTLENEAELAEFLNTNPGTELELSAFRSAAKRALAQGKIATRAQIGRSASGRRNFALANQADVAAAKESIARLQTIDPQYAGRLAAMFEGQPPPGLITDLLRSANRVFKPAAVFGVIVPRIAAAVRNEIGGAFQLAATPGARTAVGAHLRAAPGNILGSIDDMIAHVYGARYFTGNELTRSLDTIEEAFRRSNGMAQVARAQVRSVSQELAEALEHGVLDDFVRADDMIRQFENPSSPWWKIWEKPIWDAPAKMFQGIEQRMRLGAFLELRRQGTPAAEAARMTKDAFLRYETGTAANATLRTYVPFAQFIGQSIPQQAKWLATTPAVGVAAANLMGAKPGEEPLPQWIEEQAHLDLGANEDGTRSVIAGFGLPLEALNAIPNLSAGLPTMLSEAERAIIAKTQPLVKTGYTMLTGEDPYFRTPLGSYTQVPGVGEAGTAGAAYNIAAGTGLIQPVDTLLRQAGDLTDERKSVPARLLDFFTGANVATVDPDQALAAKLTDYLERNPNVRSRRTLVDTGEDPQVAELLKELRDTKARLKQKREREAAAAVP